MDKDTRNRIQRATQAARGLLEEDFEDQLAGVFDIRLDGTIAGEPGSHLDAAQRIVRNKLVAAIEHFRASGQTAAEAVASYRREAAFTTLNRFVALKMLEARGLVQECITRGEQSSGFKEFCGLAPGLVQLPDRGYRLYIESLFDELSVQIRVLFNRRDASSLLWPKRATLEALLVGLNAPELAEVWRDDETIGWIYQYYNDEAERKRMREESSAPRNSRELAVRNQFFTPRYVVEFLTDNTLGRLWYEMKQGDTRLKQKCRYLVRRLDEVFFGHMTHVSGEYGERQVARSAEELSAASEENLPPFSGNNVRRMIDMSHTVNGYARREYGIWVEQARTDGKNGRVAQMSTQDILDWLFFECRNERFGGDASVYRETWFVGACNEVRRRALKAHEANLTQEELLKQPVFIPYRPIKDPREMRLLDPACGSMHFGLYAFDLFEDIYEEAWDITQGANTSVTSAETFAPFVSFAATFSDKAAFLREIPRLIVEHNLHGIDIDRRAVQIAGLSLWLRAQRAWHQGGVKPADRPRISRSNLVCAEPMPGEKELLREFVEQQFPAGERSAFAFLLEKVFDRMTLAGEAGSLLRIEAEIGDAVAEARALARQQAEPRQFRLSLGDDQPTQPELNLPGLNDEQFWQAAEQRIYDALKAYAEQAENGSGFRRRLFADDAAQGFAFIDLCRKSYDVTVMNPPFGAASTRSRDYIAKAYPRSKNDLLAACVERGVHWLHPGGLLGAITSRTAFFLTSYRQWRQGVVLGEAKPVVMADLGYGVMDAAMVEAAAYVLRKH